MQEAVGLEDHMESRSLNTLTEMNTNTESDTEVGTVIEEREGHRMAGVEENIPTNTKILTMRVWATRQPVRTVTVMRLEEDVVAIVSTNKKD